jgi:hypothetical protein
MPRIRSLKIGFFQNEQLAELPFEHRLLFAGLWLLADREGRLQDRPRWIKALLFPYDEVDVDVALDRLTAQGFIERYVADGAAYIAVVQFAKHQRPKKDEPESAIPAPLSEHSRLFRAEKRGTEAVPSLRQKDREAEDREAEEDRDADGASSADGADLPALFVGAWHELTTPPIPRCRELTAKRRRQIRTRLTERPLTEWREVFTRIQASPFCQGTNDRGWKATLDWVIGSPDVAVKVLEGKYDSRVAVVAPVR